LKNQKPNTPDMTPAADDLGNTHRTDQEQSAPSESQDSADSLRHRRQEKIMPFLDHLEELRGTILRCLIAVVVASVVSYFFSEQVVTFLRRPAPADLQLIYLSPTEGFMIYIKVALFTGLVVVLPYVAYEFWRFIVPGLLEREKKLVLPIVFFTVVCFVFGAAFGYLVVIPFGLQFLLGFQTDFLTANLTIGKYLGFVVTLLLVFGVVFELPVLAFLLSKLGILTPQFLRNKWRYGVVIIFILAAVLTPPDVFTQLMLAGPLLLLYQISIWVSAAVYRAKPKNDE